MGLFPKWKRCCLTNQQATTEQEILPQDWKGVSTLTLHSVISPLLQIKKRILPTFASNNPLPMFLGGKRIKSIHSEIPIPLLFEENYLLRSFFKIDLEYFK